MHRYSKNFAARAIHLPFDTKFFYLYYWDGSTIRGKQLKDLVGSKIKVNPDDQNKKWRYWYGPYASARDEDIRGIEFFIDPESRAYVPPHPEPMLLSDAPSANHNRSGVDQYLVKPIPQSAKPMLWIAETMSEIELDKSVNGLVDQAVSRMSHPVGMYENGDFQSNSIFVKGGNTYGKMRNEIVSETTEGKIPESTLVRFAWA